MNRVILIGNLTKDPELITTNSGISMCKFTLAVQRRFSTADGETTADFIPVIVWRGLADNCAKFLKKGSKAGVSGSVQTRNYEVSDGSKRYVTEVVADEVEFLSSKSFSDDDYQPEKAEKATKTDKPKKAAKIENFEPIDDDELPF